MTVSVDAVRAVYAAALEAGDEEARRAAVAQLPRDGADDAALAFLVDAMGDASWRVRKEAVARAAAWPDRPRAARALTHALAEPENVGRRNAAIDALVQLGSESVPPLVEALADGGEHRKVVVDTLGLIGDPGGAAPLATFLDDPDPNVRVAAAEALGLIGGAQAQAALRRALGGGHRELLLTLAALDALNRTGARLSPDEVEPLLGEPTLRAAALEALARSGDARATAPLVRGLEDASRSVREAATRAVDNLYERLDTAGRATLKEALQALGRRAPTGPVHPVQALIQALLEGSTPVKRAAARVLGLSGAPEAVRPLVLELDDPQSRAVAAEALLAIGAPAAQALVELAPDLEGRLRADVYGLVARFDPALLERLQDRLFEALDDEDPDAAAGAARALGEAGTRDALAPLARALERDDAVALAAAEALGQLGTRFYYEVRILVQSRGLDGNEAPHLCRVLGACGRPADAMVLKHALKGQSPAGRRAAAEALGQLGPRLPAQAPPEELRALDEAADALLFALADEAPEVRAAAARAVGALASRLKGQAVAALANAAHDPDVAVRTAAARALKAFARGAGRAEALEAMRRLASSGEPVTAVPALEALGEVGAPEDDTYLLDTLVAEDAELVKAAVRGLGRRAGTPGAARVMQALERLLVDARWDVRREAAFALGAYGPDAHPLLYARRATEGDPMVAEALEQAMAQALEAAAPRSRR